MDQRNIRSRDEIVQVMRRVGAADRVPEAMQRLPPVVDLDRDGDLLQRLGLTLDHLVDEFGGSAW